MNIDTLIADGNEAIDTSWGNGFLHSRWPEIEAYLRASERLLAAVEAESWLPPYGPSDRLVTAAREMRETGGKMNYVNRLGLTDLPAEVQCYRDGKTVTVGVQTMAREWPFGRIILSVGDAEMVLTPNHARRVLRMLERAIMSAEDKLR